MSDCVVLIPVLRRPHRAAPVLESLRATTPEVRVLFIGSPGDLVEHRAVEAAGGELIVHPEDPWPGDYARKINHGVTITTEPLLFLGADDLRFHPGWLDACRRQLGPGVGVVGTNDLGNPRVMRGHHSTHSLVTRSYAERGTVDEHGKLLHEGYPHEYVDDELVGTAKARDAWAFAADARVEHLHPMWGKAPSDPIYDQIKARCEAGARIYRRRRHLWATTSRPRGRRVAIR